MSSRRGRRCFDCHDFISNGARRCRDHARLARRLLEQERRERAFVHPITIAYIDPVPGVEWDRLPGVPR